MSVIECYWPVTGAARLIYPPAWSVAANHGHDPRDPYPIKCVATPYLKLISWCQAAKKTRFPGKWGPPV